MRDNNPTIHRINHATIPVIRFKPEGGRHKILRMYEDEDNFQDYSLLVSDETDGKYVLLAYSRAVVLPADFNGYNFESLISGCDSLDQTVVDKIQMTPVAEPDQDYDFVVLAVPVLQSAR